MAPYKPPSPPYPPLVIPDGFGEARIHMTLPNTDEAICTFGYTVDPAASGDDAAATIATIVTSTPKWVDLLPTTATLDKVSVSQVRSAVEEIGEAIIGDAGVASTERATPATCVLGQKRTGLAGRNMRGRLYMPPPTEDQVDNAGMLSNGEKDAYQDVADFLLAQLVVGNLDMVLLHRKQIVLPRTTPDTYTAAPAPTPVTAMAVQRRVATQRRRNNP